MAQLHFGAGDSIGFGTTGTTATTTASFSKSSLANMQVGDLLVALIHCQTSNATAIVAPSGWTQYGALPGMPSTTISRQTSIFYYPIKSQADIDALAATSTWTFAASGRVACVVARASGIDLDNIEDTEATTFSGASNATSLAISGLTTANATTLLVGGFFHQNAAATSAPSTTSFMTDFQEYRTSTADPLIANTGAALGYSNITSAGATGNVTATMDSAAAALGGELVAFRAGSWTPPAPPTSPYITGTSTSLISQAAATSFTINKPSGLQDGDVLIMALSAQSQTATSDFMSNGWSRISQAFAASSSVNRVTAFYALPVPSVSNLDAVSSFMFISTDSAAGGRIIARMFIVRNADPNQIVDVASVYGANNVVMQTTTISPGTATINDGLLLATYNAQFVSGDDYSVTGDPAAMTKLADLVSSTGSVSKTRLVLYSQDVDAGALGNKVLTWAAVQAQSSGVSIVIRPVGAPVNDTTVQYTSATGVLSTGKVRYTSATDTLAAPREIRPFPTGYASVGDMLTQPIFYVAHRGGSRNWPEMSLHAYTQAGFWGVGALELALARTADGVWFGLHDDTLDRTSGTTDFVASQHTWAEVQAYTISAAGLSDPSQPARPYARWEEIMAAYYTSHVFFVDPKVAYGFRGELLNMMDAMPGTPTDRFVAKFYGVSGNAANTAGWAYDAAQRGYKTWGYFYQADAADFATYQGRWDILGMDYNADQATWNAIKSYGKPVIGHIVPNAGAANTAVGLGADGLMVSGVQEIIARSS